MASFILALTVLPKKWDALDQTTDINQVYPSQKIAKSLLTNAVVNLVRDDSKWPSIIDYISSWVVIPPVWWREFHVIYHRVTRDVIIWTSGQTYG